MENHDVQIRLREETGHTACRFEIQPGGTSSHRQGLRIVCHSCKEFTERGGFPFQHESEVDFEDPDVKKLLAEMREKFCREIDWMRVWF
jgi:hypothetical protein